MNKWDGKPTSTLEAQVHELQGRTITQGGLSRKAAAPVTSKQSPDRGVETQILFLILLETLVIHIFKK